MQLEKASVYSAQVGLLGLPFDGKSSFARGAAEAPAAIRAALTSPSTNLATECGLDLGAEPRWLDRGDLELATHGDSDKALAAIERAAAERLAGGDSILALGGDHSVTYPLLRAYARHFGGLTLLVLDAHPDLYEEFEGDRTSHACVQARVAEEGLVERLVEVGVRTMDPQQQRQVDRHGVEVVDPRRLETATGAHWTPAELRGPIYLSCDLDVLDPAFAPGVSHPEPGGLSVRQALEIIQSLPGPVIGADVVELNPRHDPAGLTARVAAKLVKEIAARMLRDTAPEPEQE